MERRNQDFDPQVGNAKRRAFLPVKHRMIRLTLGISVNMFATYFGVELSKI